MPLDTCFDRIVVISLPENRSRRDRLLRHREELGIRASFTWFDAINGNQRGIPGGWTAGGGGYGCMLSHCEVLKAAARDGVRRLLVLEDDVVFSPHLTKWLPRFLRALPRDWDQIYLGGQHLCYPEDTRDPLVMRPRDINRTHAYAVQHHALAPVLSHISDLQEYLTREGWHVDWQLGRAHARLLWSTWCPPWWLAGQGACVSDVAAGQTLPERWWQPGHHALSLPLTSLTESVEECPPEWRRRLLLPSDPCLEKSFREFFTTHQDNDARLATWLRCFVNEALTLWRLPVIPAAEVAQSRLARLWPAGVLRPLRPRGGGPGRLSLQRTFSPRHEQCPCRILSPPSSPKPSP